MKLINYSAEYTETLYRWLPHDLHAETVVFFPDACPGKSPLPTGTVVKTRTPDWRKYAVSDCGCGMLMLKAPFTLSEFTPHSWDSMYYRLKENKGKLGDLGSGNHFLDALQSYENDHIYFLIHTGSRDESAAVEPLIDTPSRFDTVFNDVCRWAADNRSAIAEMLKKEYGPLEPIMDRNHNSFETCSDGSVIIRKGAVKLYPGELTVIPSSMDGDVVIVRANDTITEALNSMSHGTGRIMSRSAAKEQAAAYNYPDLRSRIYIPSMISDASIKTEAPFCYRNLDDCLNLLQDLVSEVSRFAPVAYLGQI